MFAVTPRLLLRPGWAEDAAPLAAAIGDEAVARNLVAVPWPYTRADAAAFLAVAEEPRLPRLLLSARDGAAPRLAGGVGLHRAADGAVELGYWIARRAWGRGYATEGARAMIGIARDALRHRRLVAGHFVDNPASGRVLAKVGIRPAGGITPRPCRARGADVPATTMTLDLAATALGTALAA